MTKETPNIGLIKAEANDFIDFETHFNPNWDKIDTQLVDEATYRGNIYIDVTEFGISTANTGVENSDAIEVIQGMFNKNLPLYFPEGLFLFSRPIKMSHSLIGRGGRSDTTEFKPGADFVGASLIDLIISQRREIKGVALNGGYKDISIFACSDYTIASNQNFFTDVYFKSVSGTKYAIDSPLDPNGASCITGSLFIQCVFDGVGAFLNIGSNTDDTKFVNCRFQTGDIRSTIGEPFNLQGANLTFESCYIQIKNSNYTRFAGRKTFVNFGVNPITFKQCFFEQWETGINYNHLFASFNSNASLKLENIHLNLDGTNFESFVYLASTTGASMDKFIDINGVSSVSNVFGKEIISIFRETNATQVINLTINNLQNGVFSSIVRYSGSASVKLFKLQGYFNGNFHADKLSYGISPLSSNINQVFGTKSLNYFSSGSVSSAVFNMTLPEKSIYLVTVNARCQSGSPDHSITGVFKVSYLGGSTYQILSTEQVGTTLKAGNATSLTVSNPDANGAVTITINQSSVSVVTADITVLKLM